MSGRVLSFHYTLTNKKGEKIDDSRSGNPFPVMEGAQQILPALEVELFKMNVGDTKVVELAAADAYGEYNEKLKLKVDRAKLPEGELKEGMQFHGGEEPTAPIFTVLSIEGDQVELDGNHPLAGEDLTFDVEVTEIREATKEELEHGHAHGPDGHHH